MRSRIKTASDALFEVAEGLGKGYFTAKQATAATQATNLAVRRITLKQRIGCELTGASTGWRAFLNRPKSSLSFMPSGLAIVLAETEGVYSHQTALSTSMNSRM